MSWQGMQICTNKHPQTNLTVGWVDQTLVGSKKIDKAAIFSAAGDALLATTTGFNVNFLDYRSLKLSLKRVPIGSTRGGSVYIERFRRFNPAILWWALCRRGKAYGYKSR